MSDTKEKFIEDKPASTEELNKLREELPKNQRLVEVSPDHFKVLKRLNE